MDNIIVREMRPNEASTVQKIGRRAFTGLEGIWVGKPKQALVAVKDGDIVGAILYKFMMSGSNKIGYIDYAFIDPNYHNQGIGNVLYKAAIEYLWEQGCDALTAAVKDDNVGSWALLLKNGFYRVSIPQLVRHFGFMGAIKQYFGTPFSFCLGLDYYAAARKTIFPPCKDGSIKQILSYLLVNSLLLLPAILAGRGGENAFGGWIVMLAILLFSVAAELIGTRFSAHRNWKFRLNNGGGLVCLLVDVVSILPMIGNWYPTTYYKSKEFYRDMGITALVGWLSLLTLVGILVFSGNEHAMVRGICQTGAILLFYRVIPLYPFESFGGRRVYEWNKWIYAVMTFATLTVITCNFVFN